MRLAKSKKICRSRRDRDCPHHLKPRPQRSSLLHPGKLRLYAFHGSGCENLNFRLIPQRHTYLFADGAHRGESGGRLKPEPIADVSYPDPTPHEPARVDQSAAPIVRCSPNRRGHSPVSSEPSTDYEADRRVTRDGHDGDPTKVERAQIFANQPLLRCWMRRLRHAATVGDLA